MKTKISSGDVIDFTAPAGGVTAGVGVLLGSLFLIPVTSAAEGELASGEAKGVFEHVAEGAGTGQAFAPGDPVYWDADNKRLTKTATDNTKVGVAVAAKVTTATQVSFRLQQPS